MAIDRDPTANNFPNDYATSGIDNRILLRSKAIREKMYGVDVREALAQGVEIGGSVAQNAKDTSDQAQKNVQSAITTLNAQMQTANATIKSMNDLNTQLADTIKKAGDIETQAKAVLDDIQKNPDKYRGVKGDAGTIKIGTVTTAGTPSVTNTGTPSNAILNFGLVKGDKGDTGTVDNAGLTNAPAFQALQTQVNNSAVGTNLIKDSGQEFSGKAYAFHDYSLAGITELTPGKTYTISFSAKVDDKAVNCKQNVFVVLYNSSWDWNTTQWFNVPISTDYQRATGTFTVPEGVTDANCITVYLTHPVINGIRDPKSDKSDVAGTGYIKEFKIEKGSVATDWSPNPSEILTQADYAKIKAAIVALGGSLS